MSRQVNTNEVDLEAERAAIQAELNKAKASLGPSAAARRKRGKELKEAVVNSRRLRSSDRSETVISFRGSQALKDRLALKRSASRAGGERFNEWMERVIEAALDAEQRGRVVKRLEFLIAYGIATASAALASLYGFMSASGYYGVAKGVGLMCVAFVGCHGPAWIAKVKREIGWPAAVFGFVVTGFCLGVTLYGGLGTIASGGAGLRAESVKVSGTFERDRATLKRLSAEREAMKFTATDADAVGAAQAAAQTATRIRERECGNGDPKQRGPNCRTRETEEQTRLEALTVAKTNKSLTDQATKLDREIAAVTGKLDRAPAIVAPDPQASTFSQLTGFSVDMSAALYAFLFSIALETAAMFAMMVAYSGPKIAPSSHPTEAAAPIETHVASTPASLEIAVPERPAPRLVSSNAPAVNFIEFAAGALERHASSELEFDDFYLAYWQHCKTLEGRPLAPTEAVEQTNKLCRECNITIQRRGKKRFLGGVRLKTASRQRLGPMARKHGESA